MKYASAAFTFLELIIVVAIVCVLSIVVLVFLNPEEIQKKTRDSKRIKDAMTLQGILEQVARSEINGDIIENSHGASSANIPIDTVVCNDTNWLGFDICKFTSTAPLDPLNGEIADMVKGDSQRIGVMYYQVKIQGGDYEINVRQESITNANKVTNDGGDSDEWFEIFSGENNLFDQKNPFHSNE